jgi:hypothetical protein
MIRQQSSQDDLKKQVDEYHRRPQPELKFTAKRPNPILIENPNVLPTERLALVASRVESEASVNTQSDDGTPSL